MGGVPEIQPVFRRRDACFFAFCPMMDRLLMPQTLYLRIVLPKGEMICKRGEKILGASRAGRRFSTHER